MSVDSEMNIMGHAQADNPDCLAVLFSLDNSHNGVDMTKTTVSGRCER